MKVVKYASTTKFKKDFKEWCRVMDVPSSLGAQAQKALGCEGIGAAMQAFNSSTTKAGVDRQYALFTIAQSAFRPLKDKEPRDQVLAQGRDSSVVKALLDSDNCPPPRNSRC